MNELQRVELDLLKEFAHAANSEGLRWYAMFGTLLGAARHGGFIPWDDDIDVAMPRADYNRLRALSGLFREPYFLQTPENDPAAAPRFLKLRRSGTTLMKGFPNSFTRCGHMGVYMDIIPLDEVPSAEYARVIQNAASGIHNQMFASAALDENAGEDVPGFKEEFCFERGGVPGLYSLFAERYEKICSKYSSEHYYAMPVLHGERGYRIYDKEWFKECVYLDFEDIKIPVPAGWREVLVASFPNGLYEPDVEKRGVRRAETCIIDPHRPYEDYTRRYTDMLCDIKGKRVFIFGAGDSLRIWLERYGAGLNVVCVFDNSEAKWGGEAYGVCVRSPAEIPATIKEGDRLIIASIYHDEIGEQLMKMGIENYFVFIDGLNYKR